MLIIYAGSIVRLSGPSSSIRCRPSVVVCRPHSSNISETTRPIEAKFYMELPWVGGTKVCSEGLGHMTKMAATPIYGKNPLKIFCGTKGPVNLGFGMQHQGLGPNKVCSNDVLRLTLTFFTARSNFLPYAFYMGKTLLQNQKADDLET